MAMALGHPDWVLGFQDEVWWSRLAQPNLHTWSDTKPLPCSKTSRTVLTRSPKRSRVMGSYALTHKTCSSVLWTGVRSVR